jgi:hypothetical protein
MVLVALRINELFTRSLGDGTEPNVRSAIDDCENKLRPGFSGTFGNRSQINVRCLCFIEIEFLLDPQEEFDDNQTSSGGLLFGVEKWAFQRCFYLVNS